MNRNLPLLSALATTLIAVGCGGDPDSTTELSVASAHGTSNHSSDVCMVLTRSNTGVKISDLDEQTRLSTSVVCHGKGNGGNRELLVSNTALGAHIGHGDTLGECRTQEEDENGNGGTNGPSEDEGDTGGSGDDDGGEDDGDDDGGDAGGSSGGSNPCD